MGGKTHGCYGWNCCALAAPSLAVCCRMTFTRPLFLVHTDGWACIDPKTDTHMV